MYYMQSIEGRARNFCMGGGGGGVSKSDSEEEEFVSFMFPFL